MLPRTQIADTGIEVSRFALGGFHQLEISSEIVVEVVDAYLAEGGNYIETAPGYGQGASEHKLGLALQGRRDRVVLCTKTGAASADQAMRDVEASLGELQTDHVEFCLFHGLNAGGLEKVTAPGGAAEGLQRLVDQGVIRALGMSSHTPQTYLDAFDRLDLKLILVWCNYLDNFNFPIIPEQVIPEAKRRNIAITAMKPLADGFLYRSPADAVAYCMGCDADVVVVGANRVQHVRQIAAAVRSGPADATRMEQIVRDAPELGRYVCRRCGKCPAELMDTFRMEGVFDRQMIDFLPHDPADHALRNVLSGWFSHDKLAQDQFAATARTKDDLLAAAESVTCPYDIDLPRKTRLALAKLTGESAQRV